MIHSMFVSLLLISARLEQMSIMKAEPVSLE
jgi:hypothetical protein